MPYYPEIIQGFQMRPISLGDYSLPWKDIFILGLFFQLLWERSFLWVYWLNLPVGALLSSCPTLCACHLGVLKWWKQVSFHFTYSKSRWLVDTLPGVRVATLNCSQVRIAHCKRATKEGQRTRRKLVGPTEASCWSVEANYLRRDIHTSVTSQMAAWFGFLTLPDPAPDRISCLPRNSCRVRDLFESWEKLSPENSSRHSVHQNRTT